MEELSSILDTIKKRMDVKAKTIEIRKVRKDERRYGLLDSGATNNVREVKKKESVKGLIPIEVEVAFDSEVKADLFVNRYGTIIGPEGTETIVSTHEAVSAGYSVVWKSKDELIMSQNGEKLPVEVHNGTPALPKEVCLKLIDEFEMTKGAKIKPVKVEKEEDDFELQSLWPQLSKVLKWLVAN